MPHSLSALPFVAAAVAFPRVAGESRLVGQVRPVAARAEQLGIAQAADVLDERLAFDRAHNNVAVLGVPEGFHGS